MKFKGKFLFILLIIYFISVSLITLAREPKGKSSKAENINEATIKDSESNIASTSFNNLPSDEVINTFYADPLSDDFMGKTDSKLNAERNRSTSDLLSEFEGQAKVINDNTEIPDNIADEHTKEERAKIESRADKLIKEAELKESKDNSAASLMNEDKQSEITSLQERISNLDKEPPEEIDEENNKPSDQQSSQVLYDENGNNITEPQKESLNNAIIKEEWPNTEEDPEFANKNNLQIDNVDKVEIIEESDSTDDIPNYKEMQGIVPVDNDEITISNKKNRANKKDSTNKSKKKEKQKKKYESLEPILITDAKPKSIDSESKKEYAFTGMLIPEKQPLGGRKNMLRWVLQLEDGSRIPLKSNLKLLQEVRKEQNLEDYVTVKGKMRTSTFDKELRYLVPENIAKSSKKKADSKRDNKQREKTDNKNKLPFNDNLKSSENDSSQISDIELVEIENEDMASNSASINKEIDEQTISIVASEAQDITSSL